MIFLEYNAFTPDITLRIASLCTCIFKLRRKTVRACSQPTVAVTVLILFSNAGITAETLFIISITLFMNFGVLRAASDNQVTSFMAISVSSDNFDY